MNKPQLFKWKIAESLTCLTLLCFAGSATAQVTVTTSNQLGTANVWPFTPTWIVDQTDSVIDGLVPSTTAGNFNLETSAGNRNVNSLTTNTNLTLNKLGSPTTTSTNYVTYGNGSGAGSLLIYTLPASANGYNLTNITVYGGWADNGRDQQGYTILYSTVANPGSFNYLTTVNYNPAIGGNTASAIRAIINNASGGLIAANVAAVKFVLNFPTVENGYCGIAAITVGGTAAPSVVSPVVSITTSNEYGSNPFTPDWTPETPDLILGLSPATANGNFALESSGGAPVLTDGALGASGNVAGFATCGANGGSTLIYTLTNNLVNGSDVTNIVTYSGWGDGGRDGQYYTVSYSTISAPSTYIPITTVYYLPSFPSGAPANRVAIAMNDGSPLGSGVANIKFDFSSSPPYASSFNNGYQGYSEIIVQGHDTAAPPPPPSPYLTQDTLPTYAETVVGDQVIFTAAYSNSPPASLQWQFLSGGTTNNISGATSATLTLNNVQLTNSGTYRLKAVNATNGAAAPSYSTAVPLVVGSVPAPVNNVILEYAGQTGLGAAGSDTNFYPTWIINTNNDLILGFVSGSPQTPGQFVAGAGNFGEWQVNPDPTVLSDGYVGYISYWPNVGASQTEVSCGVSPGGLSMTYALITNSAPNGFDLTNITVYGGWGDSGRNEQKYQVLYSTVANPTTFISLGTFDYNPNNPNTTQSATRTTLIPASGAMARNVFCVQFNWNLQGSPPKNGQEGYSEIIIGGAASPPVPTLTQQVTPLTAEDVVGGSLTIQAGFSGATSYQWLKNGTNIPGATSTTLTLSSLQLTDTATNSGYSLVASNSSGASTTFACAVKVDPAPAAVNNVITSFAYQTDTGTFSPTWDTSALNSSLIYGQYPPAGGYDTVGNFNDPDMTVTSFNMAGGLPVLTDGNYGTFTTDGSHPAFATCGNTASAAGQYVIYTLGANANGYDVTNIQIAGGWNDSGRDAQWYTLSYSTVANPGTFIPLAIVTNNPAVTSESVIRATFRPVTGLLASNVYAIFVDFATPPGVPNGYSGYSEISVFGSPSTTPLLPPPAGTVYNPSFEFDVALGVGQVVATVPTSWTAFNEAADIDIGSENAGGTDYTVNNPLAAPADAKQYCYINMFNPSVTGGIYQDVGALQPNTPYTLTVAIGSRADRINSPGIISLINGTDNTGTVLASGGGLPATQNTWQDYTVTFTTGPSVSGDLTIALSVLGDGTLIQADFDNVRLRTTPVAPTLGTPTVSSGKLILTGTGGTPNYTYDVLTTTNLLTPLTNWTVTATSVSDSSGAISNAIPINVTNPTSFFRLRVP
jgi:hypothetical protein